MSQNREKEETLDLKLSSSLCPENCKLPSPPPTTPTAQIPTPTPSGSGSGSKPTPPPDSARPDPPPPTTQPPEPTRKSAVNRCVCCAKRVGLTEFRCRCGELFCPVHRYSDRHHCTFDYKAAGREAIARDNPVVRAAKILKV